MANPKLNGGYTRISNELLEAICSMVTNSTWARILLWTCRLTYGFQRKEVQSNYGSYATKLNLQKDTVRSALQVMTDKKIVRFLAVTKDTFLISVNKDYELWEIR